MHLRTDERVKLLVESQTTRKVTHAQHQKNVGEDGTDHAGLYDIDIALGQGNDGNEQLNDITDCLVSGVSMVQSGDKGEGRRYIPEGGVEETTPCFTKSEGDLFGGKGQPTCERDDAQQAGDKDGDVRLAGVCQRPGDREQDWRGADDRTSLDRVLYRVSRSID